MNVINCILQWINEWIRETKAKCISTGTGRTVNLLDKKNNNNGIPAADVAYLHTYFHQYLR